MDESALLRTWQRTALAFAPVLVLVLFAGVLLNSIMQRSASTERVQDSYRRVVALHELETRIVNAETGQRGFIITGDSAYLGPYHKATAETESLLALLAAEPAPERFPLLQQQVRARLDILQRALDARAEGFDRARVQLIAGRGIEAMAALRSTLTAIELEEQRRLDAELTAQEAAGTRVLVTLGLGALLVLLVGLLTNRLLGRHAAELERLNAQLQEQSLEVELQSHELQAQTMELEENGERLQALNEMLERRTREAEGANVAKATFLRTMSHELRTPLNAISGYADLLGLEVQGPLVPAQRGSVERIRLNAQHLIGLINDVLSFARLEAGKLELHAEPVDVQRIFEEAEQLVRSVLDGRGLEYHCAPAPGGLAAYADPDRTRQILLNLLANAAKHSAGGCRVELSADATEGQVLIRVRDSGPGIPLELQESIFEPFVQGHQENGSLHSGTGLGLSISRGLARSMGGDLLLESVPGQGATFTLVLPRAILVSV